MSQATLHERSYRNSNLFSGHYLDERVQEREEWDCDAEARQAMNDLQALYDLEGGLVEGYGEDALIDNWIDEVLDILGFGTQEEVTLPDGGGFVDELLFESPTARRDAAEIYLDTEDTTDLFERGVGIVEAKQWDAAFDIQFSEQRPYRNASHQTKHYLENTPPDIQWGILTNGRKWRLYGTNDYETQTYYEVDLPELLQRGDLEAFKYFYVFFRPAAFHESGGTTFHDEVWSESETASQELGENLQDNVFTALRVLGRGFVETNDELDIDPDDEEALDELKEQSLVFLYRLMFVLYAEARGLIHPEDQAAQDEYDQNFSLDELRLDIHDTIGEVDEGFEDEFSDYSTTMWGRLEDLFRLIDEGEEDLGIPPYDGGLFDHDEHEFLTEHEVSNQYLAEVIYRLSTTQNDEGRYVLADYADLDTRHLGSVYEGLLEHQFRIAPEQYAAVAEDGSQVWKPATGVSVAEAVETVPEGGLYVVNDEGERKATGAYYTPDYVVTYIVEETAGPLVEEIREDLVDQGFKPGTQEYIGPFFRRVTDLRILDPAMGSGHFLTKATGYLSEQVMAEVREAEEEFGVAFDEQHIRREIAKECIYGVDLNGMAVELAKLSMWLETLAADRPLAFLDHHFKKGNSLVGSDIEDIEELESDANGDDDQYSLAEFGATREGTIERLMDIYSEFLAIENETVEDVREMKRKYAEIEQDELRQRLVAMANISTAEDFGENVPSGAYERMARALEKKEEWASVEATDWYQTAKSLAGEHDFFHWKLSFPEVFYEENGKLREDYGFDAVIGNPPWVSNWELTESHTIAPNTYERMYPEATTGHWDLFILFSYRAYDLVKDSGGYHSFIVPSSFATQKYGKSIREHYIKESQINQLVNFDHHQIFEDVDRQYLIYIISSGEPDGSQTRIIDYVGTFEDVFSILQKDFLDYSNYSMRVDIGKEDVEIKNSLENQGCRLGRICCVNVGVVAHAGSHSELEFSKDDVVTDVEKEGHEKFIEGSDVGRYSIDWSGLYIEYHTKKEHFHRPKFRELFESEKVMVPKIENYIRAYYDNSGYYNSDNIMNIVTWSHKIQTQQSPKNFEPVDSPGDYNLKVITSILNSTLIKYYYVKFLSAGALQGDYSNIYPDDLRKIPIHSKLSENRDVTERLETEVQTINQLQRKRNSPNLCLFDYLGSYSEGLSLIDIGIYQPPEGVGETELAATKEDYGNIRVGTVTCEREDESTVVIHATARYKPDDEDAHETDQWGYTETEPMPAMRLTDLSETEADLVEAFVPVAVEEAGGFAGFRETATKTNSLVDRLEAITLPDPDDVADDLERYREAVERAAELNEKIQRTDDLIDEIVYELYGLSDEEIEIVEEAVGDD